MKVLIIGAGWYGCHIAKKLLEKGICITLVDKKNGFFNGSSYKNQNRLHLGFHYPRSSATIKECIEGYYKFMKEYTTLTTPVPKNLYFISSNNSLIDISSYKTIFDEHDISYNIYKNNLPLIINNIESPIIQVDERYINPFSAKEYFTRILSPYLKYISDTSVFSSIEKIIEYCNEPYDFILNCTFNQLQPIPYEQCELFVTLLYKINTIDLFAYTIMDGPFFSIYPYDISNNIYTVTSVVHGVAYKGELHDYTLSEIQLNSIIQKMDMQIKEYIPEWNSIASYMSHYTSWKMKHNTTTDDRSVRHAQDGNILSIYGGKITGIFEAEKIVMKILQLE